LNQMERDPLAKKNGYSAKPYVKILEDNLLGIWSPGLIFIHDNAPIHNAGAAKLWLEEHGITLMKWPPYSPDLNPIKHLWFHLKKMVYEVRPDIEQVRGDDEKVRTALFETLEEAWPRLSEELLATLIGSMKSRVNSFIGRQRGGHPHLGAEICADELSPEIGERGVATSPVLLVPLVQELLQIAESFKLPQLKGAHAFHWGPEQILVEVVDLL